MSLQENRVGAGNGRFTTGANTDLTLRNNHYLNNACELAVTTSRWSKGHVFGAKVSESLLSVLPSLLEQMGAVLADPNSSVEQKLYAADLIARVQAKVEYAAVSKTKSAAIVKKARVKADATALKRRLAAEKSHRRVEETLRRAEKSLEDNNA